MILHYVHRGEVIHQHISGHVPVPGDQVTIGGYWYVVLERYWHWDAGMVEIAVAPPVEVLNQAGAHPLAAALEINSNIEGGE